MNQAGEANREIVIYVGTRKLIALEGIAGQGEPRVTRFARNLQPEGFQNGLVTHLEKASSSLQAVLKALDPTSNFNDAVFYAVLGNQKLKTYHFASSQYYQGIQRSLTAQEIRSVVDQTRSVATLPLSEFVLQAIPESFTVNDTANIRNPLGLEAHRLSVNLEISTMSFQEFKNISRAFEVAEIEIENYFPKTLTVSAAVLTEMEKEEGAAIVDVAQDHTHLILWKNGSMLGTRALPWGNQWLIGELAKGLEIEACDAAKLKERYGSLEGPASFGGELIPTVERNGKANHQMRRQEFQEKFLTQVKNWTEKILGEVECYSKEEGVLFPHFVFTGGGISMDGFLEYLHRQFSKDARIGTARKMEAPTELLVDPSMAGALGLFRWLSLNAQEQKRFFSPSGFLEKTFASARDWFSSYF